MNDQVGNSILEDERLKKNAAAKVYYHANKSKVVTARKTRKTKQKTEICLEKGIPEFLAEHITFKSNDQILLTFKDTQDLFAVLYRAKFKSQYTKDITKTVIK